MNSIFSEFAVIWAVRDLMCCDATDAISSFNSVKEGKGSREFTGQFNGYGVANISCICKIGCSSYWRSLGVGISDIGR